MLMDENLTEECDKTQVQVKRLTVPANEAAPKRVALGEIQNLGLNCKTATKNMEQKELKDSCWKKQRLDVNDSIFNYNLVQEKTTKTTTVDVVLNNKQFVNPEMQKKETVSSLVDNKGAIPAVSPSSQSTHSQRSVNVEDMDTGDQKHLTLDSEYDSDICNHLYELEDRLPIRVNHLGQQVEVTSRMRAVLIDWLNDVHLQFQLVTETFHLAVAIIDRYLQVVNTTKRQHFQLVGVTALFIATKYEEMKPPVIADFVYIADDAYTHREIRQMELQILKAIDSNLSRPLSIHFLHRFVKAANAEGAHHAMSKYFLELSTLDCGLSSYKPSKIAAASLYLSLHLLNGNAAAATVMDGNHWTPTLMQHSRYTEQHLRPITRQIAKLAREAPHANLRSVYSKYQASKFGKIALRPELSGPLMDLIVDKE
ncbi:hypothetical protein ACLKA7_006463 [Drosophila subpalustris]